MLLMASPCVTHCIPLCHSLHPTPPSSLSHTHTHHRCLYTVTLLINIPINDELQLAFASSSLTTL